MYMEFEYTLDDIFADMKISATNQKAKNELFFNVIMCVQCTVNS